MNQLHVLCSRCARHVRASEALCPFCGATVTEAPKADYSEVLHGMRLSRAATLMLGASLMASCIPAPMYGGPPTPAPRPDAGVQVSPAPDPTPVPPVAVTDVGVMHPVPAPVYGGPPPIREPVPTPRVDDPGMAVAAYGAPAPDGFLNPQPPADPTNPPRRRR